MNLSDSTRVVFFQVRENSAKIKKILEMAEYHFEKKEPILFLLDDDKGLSFVDELLWKSGFLPHVVAEELSKDFIVITKVKKNLNGARVAFNLCPTPLVIEGNFKIIYEFEDLTAPNKKSLSALRFDAYKQAGHLIEAR